MICNGKCMRHIKISLLFIGTLMISAQTSAQSVQNYFGTSVTVINMIPYDQGGESNQDSEPNLAVNPANPLHIAGSAFTPNPMEDEQSMLLAHVQSSKRFRTQAVVQAEVNVDNGGIDNVQDGLLAPIYISTDGGTTWQLNPIIEHANAVTGTNDITLEFSGRGGILYAALLEGTSGFTKDLNCPGLDPSADPADEIFVKPNDCVPVYGPRMAIRRSTDFTSSKLMTGLSQTRQFVDQPYIQVVTVRGVDGNDADRVFVANNDLNRSTNLFPGSLIADSRTATIDRSLKGNKTPHGLYESHVIEPSSPLGQNGSGVRAALHSSGRVYGIFYHFTSKSGNIDSNIWYTTNIVVVRVDNWGLGPDPFLSSQSVVAAIRRLPIRTPKPESKGDIFTGPDPDMGQERLVASDISIAVHPRNKDVVYVAWADSEHGIEDSYNLHVRRSVDGAHNWSEDLLTIPKAKNPALAVNRSGTVGFLYQAFEQNDNERRWVTHFRLTGSTDSWRDIVLADVPADSPRGKFLPYIGDYVHLLAVDVDFYGIFSANNQPNPDNFPQGVTYQRYVDNDGILRANAFSEAVAPSIDPFFFKVTQPWFPDTIQKAK